MNQQLVLDVAPAFEPTLENFIPGPNQEVLSALRAVAAGERHERYLYVFGVPGSGKTHLLRAIAAHTPGARYLAAGSESGEPRVPRELASVSLIALDDVEALAPAEQENLFHLFNAVRTANTRLIVAAQVAPGQLKLRADLATRLASMLAYSVQPLSDADKMHALRQYAQQRGFALSAEVIDFLLKHWRRDLPSLMRALDRLDAYSLATHRAVTVPLLKQAVAELGSKK